MRIKTDEEYANELVTGRSPGTCCPEPTCDYLSWDGENCRECGAKCAECKKEMYGYTLINGRWYLDEE